MGDHWEFTGPESAAGCRSIELGVYAASPTRKRVATRGRVLIDFLVNAFMVRTWTQ